LDVQDRHRAGVQNGVGDEFAGEDLDGFDELVGSVAKDVADHLSALGGAPVVLRKHAPLGGARDLVGRRLLDLGHRALAR
jgi:hypothetical protein